MIDYDKIFNQILEASSRKKDMTSSKNYLKTDHIGNSITGRILPNFKDIDNTVWYYCHHGWTSKLDGFGLFYLCPSTLNMPCPICKRSIQLWKSGSDADKEISKGIRRRQNWITNFYVISNPKNPEDNGTIKLLRMGKQLHDKYLLATEGEDKAIYGKRIFMLDENGCNFRIKCEATSDKNSDKVYPTYSNSGFLPASKIEGMTEEKIGTILGSVFDLTKLWPLESYKKLTDELERTYFINDVQTLNASSAPSSAPAMSAAQEALASMGASPTVMKEAAAPVTESAPVAKKETPAAAPQVLVSNDQIDQMLADLQKK